MRQRWLSSLVSLSLVNMVEPPPLVSFTRGSMWPSRLPQWQQTGDLHSCTTHLLYIYHPSAPFFPYAYHLRRAANIPPIATYIDNAPSSALAGPTAPTHAPSSFCPIAISDMAMPTNDAPGTILLDVHLRGCRCASPHADHAASALQAPVWLHAADRSESMRTNDMARNAHPAWKWSSNERLRAGVWQFTHLQRVGKLAGSSVGSDELHIQWRRTKLDSMRHG